MNDAVIDWQEINTTVRGLYEGYGKALNAVNALGQEYQKPEVKTAKGFSDVRMDTSRNGRPEYKVFRKHGQVEIQLGRVYLFGPYKINRMRNR